MRSLGWSIVVLSLSCAKHPALAPLGPPPAHTTVRFVHFNDLHAHLTPHWDLVADGHGGTTVVERGGLARIATVVRRLREENPHALLMNIGDTYHGGVEALFTNGNAIVAPMNALGVDVGVPGNWDFAYGPIVTRRRYVDLSGLEKGLLSTVSGYGTPEGDIERPTFPNLAANVTFTKPFWKAGRPFLPPTLVKDVGDIRVGFVGLTSDMVPTMNEILAEGLSFLQGEDAYRELVARHAQSLRDEGAQVVVVMSELGLQKDYRLAQVVPAGLVDVFFSAHTHEATFEPLTSASGALVVEAGNDGYVGRMDVTLEGGRVTNRAWELLPVGRDIPEDPQMKHLVDEARAPFVADHPAIKLPIQAMEQRVDQPVTAVVGHVDGALHRRHALDNPFNAALASALRARAGTDVALTPGFRFDAVVAAPGVPLEDDTVAQGAVTLEDVYRFFPIPFAIGTGRISAGELKAAMEEQLEHVFAPNVFAQRGGWFEGYGGLQLEVDLANPTGHRVVGMSRTANGPPLEPDAVLSVAGWSRPMDAEGVLSNTKGFRDVAPLKNAATGRPWTYVELLLDVLKHDELHAVATPHVVDRHETPLWPATPFVQPLEGAGGRDDTQRR